MGAEIPESDTGKHQALLHTVTRTVDELRCDLASEKAAREAQEQEIAQLREALRSRDHALSIVAHDLRNPLNVIVLAANVLLDQVDVQGRGVVERILRGAQRADRLVRDLLDVNAMETGRFTIETALVNTPAMILAALESQKSLAGNASIIVSTDISPDLPMADADQERIFEIFENLIGNAIKFTPAGGSIVVGATTSSRDVLFWVKDSGCGIEAEQIPHLFDRFWQAKRARRGGNGLGLTICKAIVDAHGGRIWVDSTPDVGTTVYFTLPAKLHLGPSDVQDVANILIVDDRPENLLSLQAILDRPEYRLVTASSGEEALALALRDRFSVALIDISMPGMNGLEVATHLKGLERSREIPIIFVTAFGDDPDQIHRAYSAGGVDYLVKPLDAEIVRKKVAVFVDLTRRRRTAERSREQ